MPHLLLVDDDEDILSLLTAFFRKHGHHVSTAATGAEMFAVLEGEPIDIVIEAPITGLVDRAANQPTADFIL
jgi:two-component system OmpR family response regulator